MARTQGELAFEQYLTARGMSWTYEEKGHITQVDYLVRFPAGAVICEVKDFTENETDKMLYSGMTLGVDPYKRIRKKINEAREQFRPYKGKGLPCVLVLHTTSISIVLGWLQVFGAMFGDLGVEVDLAPPHDSRPYVDLTKGKLKRLTNTTISGIAVVEQHRTNQAFLDSEIDRRLAPISGETIEVTAQRIFDIYGEIERDFPEKNFDEVAPRIRWLANPHAAVPLPHVFDGPYDAELAPFD